MNTKVLDITSLSLLDVYRAQTTKRWHIVESKRTQSVAEHGYMVAMISLSILKAIKIQDLNIKNLVMKWALVHDLPEVILGDAPSPVKKALKKEYDKLEKQVDPKWYGFKESLPSFVKNVVKIADLIDALVFLSKESTTHQSAAAFYNISKNFYSYIKQLEIEQPNVGWGQCFKVSQEFFSSKETLVEQILSTTLP